MFRWNGGDHGSIHHLNWIRLERLGKNNVDPASDSSERLRMGKSEVKFEKGLLLKNVSGLNWSPEFLKSGTSGRLHSSHGQSQAKMIIVRI